MKRMKRLIPVFFLFAIMMNIGAARAQSIEWISQFGTTESELTLDCCAIVSTDSSGNIYVVGQTGGTLPGGGGSAGLSDAYIRKYDSTGALQWTDQFGTTSIDRALSVSAVGTDIYVAGSTQGDLDGGGNAGNFDVFIRKYDTNGSEQWTTQIGTSSRDLAQGVSVDSSGDYIYVVGNTQGDLDGGGNAGSDDAYIAKFDSTFGNLQCIDQFGSTAADEGLGVSADTSETYVVGDTLGSLFAPFGGTFDAYIVEYDSDCIQTSDSHQFGTPSGTVAWDASVDSSGNVYVAGATLGTLPVGGGFDSDAFVRKYDSSLNIIWTEQFGTSADDFAQGVSVNSGIYVSGETQGALPGQTGAGGADAFVRKYDSDGNTLWTTQFGGPDRDNGMAVSVDSVNIYVAGDTNGALPGQTHVGSRDAFLVKLIDVDVLDALDDLTDEVLALGLPDDVEDQLIDPLDDALDLLADDNLNSACARMTVFIKRVDRWENKGELAAGDADDLREAAEEIKVALGCK